MKKSKKDYFEKGQVLVAVVISSAFAIYLLGAIASWAVSSIIASRHTFHRERAIQIAEAGIDYYRWHLAHAPQDFQDGTGQPGPYIHDFYDKDGNIIGQFSLDITPPPIGSTLATIQSMGSVAGQTLSRKITVQMAKPSMAKYAIAANDVMRFGPGTEVFGPIHSNQGIRFDGLAHNVVSSAVAFYNDPDHGGPNDFGVHTHILPQDPVPPADVPLRPDIFETGRQFPVPAVDFTGITTDLANLKTIAQSDGFYRTGSGALGYHIILKTDGTFDLYSVSSLVNPSSSCRSSSGGSGTSGWGTWSIQGQQLLGNYPFPANGVIFLEDDVWVDGQIQGGRLNIAAGVFPDNPTTRKNIIVNENLLYSAYDGSDVIGLIAQNNINIGLKSADTLRIDAALIAQNGRVGRFRYTSSCDDEYERDTIATYGMIATSKRYGFAWSCGVSQEHCSGYINRNLIYDASLLYAPPPSFPLTSDQYVTLSWEESR